MAGLTKKTSAFHDENLSGRSQKLFFEVTEEENFTYYGNHEVDFNKRTSIDCEGITAHDLNQKIRDAIKKGLSPINSKNSKKAFSTSSYARAKAFCPSPVSSKKEKNVACLYSGA